MGGLSVDLSDEEDGLGKEDGFGDWELTDTQDLDKGVANDQ